MIDSVAFKVYLPEEKIQIILFTCSDVLFASSLTIRKVSHLIDLFTSARNAIRLGPLLCWFLNKDKVRALSNSDNDFDQKMELSLESKAEIKWWQDNIVNKNGKDIRPGKIEHYIETDASKLGWGANFEDSKTGGWWSQNESGLHINILECKAVYFALLSLCNHLHDTHIICIKCDNSTTVAYLNNQGGYTCRQRLFGFGVRKKGFIWLQYIPV